MAKAADFALFSLILILSSWTRAFGDAIVNAPSSARAEPGQWANFTCTVDCSRQIDWYVEGYRSDISEECVDTGNNMMACTRVLQDCSTTMSTSGRTQQLSVMANTEMEGLRIAVQCAAILVMYDPLSPDPCNPYIVYSRLAYLNVDSPPTTPDPTPVVCPPPAPSASHETVTHTVTETVTETSTVTLTPSPNVVTHTVVASVNGPECTPTSATVSHGSFSGERRLHFSSLLRELFTWLCTLLTGLAFL